VPDIKLHKKQKDRHLELDSFAPRQCKNDALAN